VDVSPFCALATNRKHVPRRSCAAKRLIGHWYEGEDQVPDRADAAEQRDESAVAHAERIPGVARKSEENGKVARHSGR
jgi:hypothetical protein